MSGFIVVVLNPDLAISSSSYGPFHSRHDAEAFIMNHAHAFTGLIARVINLSRIIAPS